MKLKTLFTAIACTTLGIQLTACSGSDEDTDSGQMNLSFTESGQVSLSTGDTSTSDTSTNDGDTSDTTASAETTEAVVVKVEGVEIKAADSDDKYAFTFEQPKIIDLMDLQGSNSEPLLQGEELKVGEYTWIKLDIASGKNTTESYIKFEGDDALYPLYVPGQADVILHHDFLIAAGGLTAMTIDMDLTKSVKNPQSGDGNNYKLDPSLRIVDNAEVGTIQGTVHPSLLNAAGCTEEGAMAETLTGVGSAVYLYQNHNAEISDISGSENDPLTSTSLTLNEAGEFEYEIGYVLQGDYSIAFTCQASNDDPEAENGPDTASPVTFVQPQNISVQAETATAVDFIQQDSQEAIAMARL